MKQELPIAIVLLAIGCLPFLWHSEKSSEVSAAVEPVSSTVIAPWQEHPETTSPAIFANADLNVSNNLTAKAFLKQVAESFANGPSTFGDLAIENHLFKSRKISGRFWCRGIGSGRSRIELIVNSTVPAKLTQVCDGRFLYRLTEQNDKQQISFLSLDKLNNPDAGIIESTLPANWIGNGSIDSLFSNIAEAFNFDAVKSSSDNQYVELVGSWSPDHLAKLMVNWVDHREILPTPDWSKLPPQFPHGARLRFANSGGKWLPVEVIFFEFDTKNDNQPVQMLSIKFASIREQAISEDLFQIDADATGAIDQTELYNGRVDLLMGNQRVAEEIGDTIR